MTAEQDAAAEREIQRIRQARRDDSRLIRENTGTSRKPLWRIRCANCSTALTIGEDLDLALALARKNATKRPCCEMWGEPCPF